MNESSPRFAFPASHSIVNSYLIFKPIGSMNLLQILRVAGHIVTNIERQERRLRQDGFGLDRTVDRRRFIYPLARRLSALDR